MIPPQKRSSQWNRSRFAKFQAINKKKIIELETEVEVKFSLVIFLFDKSKNSAVLEPSLERIFKDLQASSRPRTSKWSLRTPPLVNRSLIKNYSDSKAP